MGHGMATAVDCLAWTLERDGDDQALPLVQALAALAELTRGRDARRLRDPQAGDLVTAIETEDHNAAMGIARDLAASADPSRSPQSEAFAPSKKSLATGAAQLTTQTPAHSRYQVPM